MCENSSKGDSVNIRIILHFWGQGNKRGIFEITLGHIRINKPALWAFLLTSVSLYVPKCSGYLATELTFPDMTETPFDYRLFSTLAPIVIVLEVVVLYRLQRLWNYYHARLLWALLFMCFSWLSLDFFRVVSSDAISIYQLQVFSTLFLFFIPPTWFLLAYSYFLGQVRIPKQILYSVYILPSILTIILLTNSQHNLYWTDSSIVRMGVFLRLDIQNGPAYWLNMIQGFGFVGASLILYASRVKSAQSGLPSNNIRLLIAALFLPTIVEITFLAEMISGWQKDLVPIVIGISAILLHEAFLPGYRGYLLKSDKSLSGEFSQTT